MILSPGRRYIFVHIPKTGGTSLALALEARAMRDDILIGDTPKAVRRRGRLKHLAPEARPGKHATLAEAEAAFGAEALAGLFVVTLVRNPWDRLVSYYHWLRAQRFDHPAVRLARAETFTGFLNAAETQVSLAAHPYARYVTDGTGRERCDLFARLEHLEADLAPFEAHLGFALGPLPHANRSDRTADYRAHYSQADAALVGRLCAADAERFGYRF